MIKRILIGIGVLCTLMLLTINVSSCKKETNNPPEPVDTIPDPPTPGPTPGPTPEPTPVLNGNNIVVYECNERLFASSNALQAVRNYLPILQQMQVNVLWLMPIQPRGEVKTVWSPYCVKDYTAVSPDLGTLEDVKSLVKDAHERGMLVILDWVANHTAWDHAWVAAHPNWYTPAQTTSEREWQDVTFLDFGKTEVQDAMCEAMLYWVREADVDGFRCDYAEGVPSAFWKRAITAVRQVKPDALWLAESSKTVHFNDGFNWIYSWDYLYGVEDLYKGTKTLTNLWSVSKNEFNSTPAGKNRLRYVTTHDASSENAPSSFFRDANGMLSAFCLTAFMGGVPMIYSSQDIGYMNRIDFCTKTTTPLSFLGTNPFVARYQQLMKVYVETSEARKGEVTNYSTDKVGVFTRSAGGQSILVMANTTATVQVTPLPMDWQKVEAKDCLSGTMVTTPKSATLDKYEYRIYLR